jgi:hypothetical protein
MNLTTDTHGHIQNFDALALSHYQEFFQSVFVRVGLWLIKVGTFVPTSGRRARWPALRLQNQSLCLSAWGLPRRSPDVDGSVAS